MDTFLIIPYLSLDGEANLTTSPARRPRIDTPQLNSLSLPIVDLAAKQFRGKFLKQLKYVPTTQNDTEIGFLK